MLVQHSRASRYRSDLMLFYTQIAVLESREPSVVEGTNGQDLGADEKLSSQDSVTNTQSTDSLLGKKAYTLKGYTHFFPFYYLFLLLFA